MNEDGRLARSGEGSSSLLRPLRFMFAIVTY